MANADSFILLITTVYKSLNEEHKCLMDIGNGIIVLLIGGINVNTLARRTNVNFYSFVFPNCAQFVFIKQCKRPFFFIIVK